MTDITCHHDKDLTCGCGANWTCPTCNDYKFDEACACVPKPPPEPSHEPTTCAVCLKMFARLVKGDFDGVTGRAFRIALDLAHLGKGVQA